MNRNNDRIKRIVASAILLFLSGSYDIMNIKFAVGGKNPSAGSRPQLSIRSVRSYYRPQEPGENPPEKIPRCKSYDGFYQLFNQWNQPWQCLRDHRTRIHHGLRNCQNADVIVWSIEQSGTDTFSATYEVDQQIKEGEQTSNVKATYTVKVHVDADGDMVIVQNPTLAPAIEKSDYEPKTPEANASVDADTVNDATAFLETFFKLYPTATEKELAYYVSGNVLEPIGRDYIYAELVNPIFTKDGDNVKVKVAVKFLDNQTKATQISQYELVLHKDSNWKIVG